MPENRLIAAYRATDYHVFADPPFVLRVDEASAPCDALLAARGARSAAFLTAWNPQSEPRPRDWNERAQDRLTEHLGRVGLAFVPGEGRGRAGNWPAEQSVLVIGVGRPQAEGIAAEFGQKAFVWIEAGKPAELVFTASQRPHGPLPRRDRDDPDPEAPSENWLRRLIRTALDRGWCLDPGCTTCGAKTFRRALRSEAAAALGRLPSEHLEPEEVLHVYAAIVALRPDPEEAKRITPGVRLALKETGNSARGRVDLTDLLERSWAWSTLYGFGEMMAPGLGPVARPASPPPDPTLRGPVWSIHLATDGSAWDEAAEAKLAEKLSTQFRSWTVIEARGRFEGRDLPTRIIQIATRDEQGVKRAAQRLAAAFGQTEAGLVRGPDYRSVEAWKPPAQA